MSVSVGWTRRDTRGALVGVGTRGAIGPQGPQGPAGPIGLLAVDRIAGLEEQYYANFTAANGELPVVCNYAGSVPLRLWITPSVNCWWEVTTNIGLISKGDSVWAYLQGGAKLIPADVDGYGYASTYLSLYGPGGSQYGPCIITRTFKLQAGIQYRVEGFLSASGGTWTYYLGKHQLSMEGKAWAR